MPSGLRRIILWDYQRGVWQYDVICAAILLFIFASPAKWFGDQPRIPIAAQITSLPAHPGELVFWFSPDFVDKIPEAKRLTEISKIMTARTGKKCEMTHIEPLYNDEQELEAYLGYARPQR